MAKHFPINQPAPTGSICGPARESCRGAAREGPASTGDAEKGDVSRGTGEKRSSGWSYMLLAAEVRGEAFKQTLWPTERGGMCSGEVKRGNSKKSNLVRRT